ncbi:MAG: hypothetical protein M3N91_05345, partial [Pseudomonadota bacterium]|nr:hypothetical protein [Pseudomonadota bacterium]
EPPDPFSNSEVKTLCADASVDFVDVKVGHCQALNLMKTKPSPVKAGEGFFVHGSPLPMLRYSRTAIRLIRPARGTTTSIAAIPC